MTLQASALCRGPGYKQILRQYDLVDGSLNYSAYLEAMDVVLTALSDAPFLANDQSYQFSCPSLHWNWIEAKNSWNHLSKDHRYCFLVISWAIRGYLFNHGLRVNNTQKLNQEKSCLCYIETKLKFLCKMHVWTIFLSKKRKKMNVPLHSLTFLEIYFPKLADFWKCFSHVKSI